MGVDRAQVTEEESILHSNHYSLSLLTELNCTVIPVDKNNSDISAKKYIYILQRRCVHVSDQRSRDFFTDREIIKCIYIVIGSTQLR